MSSSNPKDLSLGTLLEKVLSAKARSNSPLSKDQIKGITNSTKRYAKALGFSDTHSCFKSSFLLPKHSREAVINRLTAAGSTLKQTRSEIKLLFDLGVQFSLIPTAEEGASVTKAQTSKRPFNITRKSPIPKLPLPKRNQEPYLFHFNEWPESLAKHFSDEKHWFIDADVAGRDENRRLAESSMEGKLASYERFFGFLVNKRDIRIEPEDLSMEMLTDFSYDKNLEKYTGYVAEYIDWAFNTAGSTQTLHKGIRNLATRAKYYCDNEESHDLLLKRKRQLPIPEPVLTPLKRSRMISPKELFDAGVAEWPKKSSITLGHRPLGLANIAGRALLMMITSARPMRNQNFRQAMEGTHILKDESTGNYRLFFTGGRGPAKLKKDKIKNKLNIYDMPLPSKFTPLLDEYFSFWRPFLIVAPSEKTVFLSRKGKPYKSVNFNTWFQNGVYLRTGKRVNIHLTRDGYVSAAKKKKVPSDRIATVLNNTALMVDEVYDQTQAQEAAEQLDEDLGFSSDMERMNYSPTYEALGGLVLQVVDKVLDKLQIRDLNEQSLNVILRTVESTLLAVLARD